MNSHNKLNVQLDGNPRFHERKQLESEELFKSLIQEDQRVGDVFSIDYQTARVLVNDFDRQRVGGIPSLSFLLATRYSPDYPNIYYEDEDTSIILLRVMDSAPLPQDGEAERIRVETSQRISGEGLNWDEKGAMDVKTRHYLSYAGVLCRIIGTFYFDIDKTNPNKKLQLRFGSDISNYYPNRGLKVYKPNGAALQMIVNHRDPETIASHERKYGSKATVKLGRVRYTSTDRGMDEDKVQVDIHPADLLSQKTALFGMTRTGKSNSTKIIAKSVYELRHGSRWNDAPLRIGQIIFDPNGEYANENVQDNNTALKNIWSSESAAKREEEVVTYGVTPHSNDPDRKLMRVNFFDNNNLSIGKEIIDNLLSEDNSLYLSNFTQVSMKKPISFNGNNDEETIKYMVRVLAYKSLLTRAGFEPPENDKPQLQGLFPPMLLDILNRGKPYYQQAARYLSKAGSSWGEVAYSFQILEEFMRDYRSGYNSFENAYVSNSPTGSMWGDEELQKLLGMFRYPNGIRKIGQVRDFHSEHSKSDYVVDIYNDLRAGKLVIVDQSSGEPELNKASAERIMWHIFRSNQKTFTSAKEPPEILIYIEEAHNLLPAGKQLDLSDVWVRTAKEGAKYNLGMVYATQEVSSIQNNILKNTANWFISHLNNTDETRELCKYYDFVDFEPSIRRAQDKGFTRMKTLSNVFVIPVQIDLFSVQ